jgi:Tol biopolymer transport system component
LYWATVLPHKAVAVVPVAGGDVREVMSGGDLPMWSPDGRRISYTYDYDRMADGALPMDVGVISVDSGVHRTSEPTPFVTGYHEDLTAAWSPDGRWIAWHSHRPPTPVPFYDSPGHTDDVYLRRAEDRHAPELRVTDFGWEVGPQYWSPDGRRLLFSSWDKGGTPYIDKLWIATIDPATGKLLHADRVPLPSTLRSSMWAMWSPNGKEIAIEDNEDNGKRTLWVMHPDGSHAQKLVDYSGNTYGALDWTVDGKAIIYAGLAPNGRNQLFAIPRAGGPPRQITQDSANLIHPRISPNGQWIAVSRLERVHQIWKQPL